MNKRILIVAALLIALLLVSGCGSSGQIGIVDMQKIMTDSPKAKALQAQFDTKRNSLVGAADATGAQKELMAFGQDLEKQMQTALTPVLSEVAKSHGFTAIAYTGALAQGGVDVTDEVVAKLK